MWLECIVCCTTKEYGELTDKRVAKTTCSPLCYAILMEWAKLPDPRPTLYQCYLKAKDKKK